MSQPKAKHTLSMPLKFEEGTEGERIAIGIVTEQTQEALIARKAKYGDNERA